MGVVIVEKGLVILVAAWLAFCGLAYTPVESAWQEIEVVFVGEHKPYVFSRDGVESPIKPEGLVKIRYREKDGNLEIDYDGQRAKDIERVFEIIQKHEKNKGSWWDNLAFWRK